MTPDELDEVYVLLSRTLAAVPRSSVELFLARVVLILAAEASPEVVRAAVEDAKADLDAGPAFAPVAG